MALKINTNFNVGDIEKSVRSKLERIELAVVNRLKFTGETFVTNARNNANFTDRTGNLRASIGYVILKNGERVDESFTEGIGGSAGNVVSIEIAAQYPKGFVLIVVAGMEYAAAVESKNFDVITASSLIAEDELKKAIEALNGKIPLMN